MLAFVWSLLDFKNHKTLWKVGTLFQKQENCIKSTKKIKVGLLMELLIIPVHYNIIFASPKSLAHKDDPTVDKKETKIYNPLISLWSLHYFINIWHTSKEIYNIMFSSLRMFYFDYWYLSTIAQFIKFFQALWFRFQAFQLFIKSTW